MSSGVHFVLWAIPALASAYALFLAARAYLKFHGKRLVTCPESHQPAAVDINSGKAAMDAIIGTPHLRLSMCSRWPERQDCGQQCLSQIESAPDGCLVRTIVAKYYEGKSCAICGKPIHEVEWMGHKPAFLDPQQRTVYWDAVPAEKLPEFFSTLSPVCWDCHVAYTLQREHPELVVERPWRRP